MRTTPHSELTDFILLPTSAALTRLPRLLRLPLGTYLLFDCFTRMSIFYLLYIFSLVVVIFGCGKYFVFVYIVFVVISDV